MKNSEEQAERRVGRGREPAAEMRPEEVIRLVDRLKKSGVEVWLDGGWCVDALLGERRRPHDDLDLVVDLRDVPQLQETLSQERYELLVEQLQSASRWSIQRADRLTFTRWPSMRTATSVYKMRSGEDWIYPASGFAGKGEIHGQQVHCLTPEVQMLCHTGYELSS